MEKRMIGKKSAKHIWDESSLLEHLILSTAAEELTHKQMDFIGVDAIYNKIASFM
jgi:hypothetical protein